MQIDLSGKRALVTGSTAGIGLAMARGLAQSGAEVVINGRTQSRVDAAIDALTKEGLEGRLTGVAANLSQAQGAASLIQSVPRVDILVNNLGIFEPRDFFDIGDEEWERFFQTNVMSGVRLARHYAGPMVERGWGRIQFVSSESGLHIPPEMIHYGVTKAAQIAVARGLAERLAGTGVTVNSVLPGPTRSEGVGGFMAALAKEKGISQEEMEAQFIRNERPTSLIRRLATVDEVANLTVYLASEQASATTGAAMRVDGGVVRSIA